MFVHARFGDERIVPLKAKVPMSPRVNCIDTVAREELVRAMEARTAESIATFSANSIWQGQTRTLSTLYDYVYRGQKHSRNFELEIDEPTEFLGRDSAPSALEVLLAALNACIASTYAKHAAAWGITLERLHVSSEGDVDLRGSVGMDRSVPAGFKEIRYVVKVRTSAPKDRVAELHKIVERFSPLHSCLSGSVTLVPTLTFE